MAGVGALFASINPSASQGKDLQEALTKAFDAVAAMPVQERSLAILRALYPAISQMFGRCGEGSVPRFESSSVNALLGGADVEVEAIRLLRADAMAAAIKAAPWMMGEEVKSGR